MQIRRAQPDAVQWQVCVSKSFTEMTETPRITGIEIVLRHGKFFGVGIEPVTVSADFIDWHNVADVFAAEITAIASVAVCAVLAVEVFALRDELRIDGERIFGRFLGKQPLLNPRELFQINRGRERTRAE